MIDETEKRILDRIDANREQIIAFAEDIAAHPEPGFEEVRTAGKTAQRKQQQRRLLQRKHRQKRQQQPKKQQRKRTLKKILQYNKTAVSLELAAVFAKK